MMPKLPQDLIVQIISRLPVKSLLRFKSVSKTWQSIISDPQFAKLQLTTSKQDSPHRILLTTSPPQSVNYEAYNKGDSISTATRKLSYPPIVKGGNNSDIEILGSCGLVCLLDETDMLMLLWNPTAGDYRQLSNPDGALYGVFLHGIGYNYINDDYGVVFGSRFTSNDSRETIIQLYTLKTGTWRRVHQDIDQILGSGISLNGNIYWLSFEESVIKVVCFDMVEEKIKDVLALPDDLDPKDVLCTARLGISGESLCVFIERRGSKFEGLLLKINGVEGSCIRMFSFGHDRFGGYNMPLCLTKNGDVLMDSDGWEIYLYNPQQRDFNTNFRLRHHTESQSQLYVETLVSTNN